MHVPQKPIPSDAQPPEISELSLPAEFILFLQENRKWWMLPLIVMTLFLGSLLTLASVGPLSPFLYALF